jgi:hypothetical protein
MRRASRLGSYREARCHRAAQLRPSLASICAGQMMPLRLSMGRWATARASPKSGEICSAVRLTTIHCAPERCVERLRCDTFAAPVDVTPRRHSFPSIDTITNNSVDAARRAESGWVVSSMVSIRSALRSLSICPRLAFRDHSARFPMRAPGAWPRTGRRGRKLSGCWSAQVVRACQNAVFSRQESASAISGRRPSGPALESMIERG